MKKLTLLILALAFSSFSNAQDSKTEWVNAADPTQLYTKLDFNAGIYTSGYSGLWGPDSWKVSLGGDFAIKKFNFGFNIPFTNIGNEYTLLGDIDLHAGFQLFNTDKLLKSSLITIGYVLPSSYNGDGFYNYGYSDFYGFNTFYADYVMSIKLNDKFSAYPKLGAAMGTGVDQYAPNLKLTAINIGLGINYQLNKNNFIQLNSEWINKRINSTEGDEISSGETEIKSNLIAVTIKYQYAITQNAQIYLRVRNDFGENLTGTSYKFSDYSLQDVFLGFQYYLK